MTIHARAVSRATTLIAGTLALTLAILLPTVYFTISYQYLLGRLDTDAETSARDASNLVTTNPRMWQFELHRHMALLERRSHERMPEIRRILDTDNQVVAESVDYLDHPTLSRRHAIYDAGMPVAQLEIVRSLRPLIAETTGVAIAALLLGGLIFLVLRILPLRAVRKAYQSLSESENRYRALYESMQEGLALFRVTYDRDGQAEAFTLMDINPACERILDLKRDKVIGIDGGKILGSVLAVHPPDLLRASATGDSFSFETQNPTTERFFSVSVFYPGPGLLATLIEDITQRKRSQDEIRKLAYSDSLTGLPNRALFWDRLLYALARADRDTVKIALLFLDLDGFKVINDTLGHASGDQLLKQVARRLSGSIRSSDTLARLGGDEFVVLVAYTGKELDVAHLAQNLLHRLTPAYVIAEREIHTSASLGIAIFPDDGQDAETLLRCADMAMYAAKEAGRNRYHFFSPEMNRKTHDRMEMVTNLRLALDREELFLEFQPIFASGNGSLVAAEALLRWRHPRMGQIQPESFIPVAEDSGFIVTLGEWVLSTACRKLKTWQDAGLPSFRLTVNVSARQLSQRDFVETVARVLTETAVDSRFIELEVNESCLIEHNESAVQTLCRLKTLGLSIGLDDFGGGCSALGHLKDFPIERLKIDRSLVTNVFRTPDDRIIIEGIIAMAGQLGLRIAAEGVETKEQAEFVRATGCDEIQGFFLSPPLSEDRFIAYLRRHDVRHHQPLPV